MPIPSDTRVRWSIRQLFLGSVCRFALAALAAGLLWASHPSDRLYQEAEQAENNGLSVRAYLLYSQLATQEPQNQLYVLKAAALKPLALKKVNVSVPSLDREGGESEDDRDRPEGGEA